MRHFSVLADESGGAGIFSPPLSHAVSASASLSAGLSAGQAGGSLALPPEIAFLARFGVALELLLRAAARATAQGVTAEAVLLGEGWLTELSNEGLKDLFKLSRDAIGE